MTGSRVTLAILLMLFTASVSAQRIGRYADGFPAVEEVIVPKGGSLGPFSFSATGALTFKSRAFSPAVQLNSPDNYTAFRIAVLHGKNEGIAAAIAEDIDGQDSLYILDLQNGTARQFGGHANVELFFERSGRHMVVLYSYEGSWLATVDLQTKRESARADLAPAERNRFWIIKDQPRWVGSTLMIPVNETCNPYEENCNIEQVLARYTLVIDPETLRLGKIRR